MLLFVFPTSLLPLSFPLFCPSFLFSFACSWYFLYPQHFVLPPGLFPFTALSPIQIYFELCGGGCLKSTTVKNRYFTGRGSLPSLPLFIFMFLLLWKTKEILNYKSLYWWQFSTIKHNEWRVVMFSILKSQPPERVPAIIFRDVLCIGQEVW